MQEPMFSDRQALKTKLRIVNHMVEFLKSWWRTHYVRPDHPEDSYGQQVQALHAGQDISLIWPQRPRGQVESISEWAPDN